MVVPERGTQGGEEKTDEGSGKADEGNGSGRGIKTRGHKQAEGKEAKQRTVGVGSNGIDGIDDARAVQGMEHQDDSQHDNAHGDVYMAAQTFVVGTVAEIDAGAGSQGGEGAVGTRQGCCHNA